MSHFLHVPLGDGVDVEFVILCEFDIDLVCAVIKPSYTSLCRVTF